ncbi:hypothetical protein C4K68_08895 [Pokkaliibacter plantistimulans]|uniref:Uncharacterized protein n=1 Tax=Proteobacteria bacterium 228 TaxID=2083153 RepID=A0A2S5KS54_9PROT|nr:hypothetical protein [Pokkaliibacter plantistimulans]PPC77687.1 hypothetical protein C4K68_08895 [Pokkaliibacter plantistimulans]
MHHAHKRTDPIEQDYQSLPWYRKRVGLVFFMLFFCPAIWVLAMSGDCYTQQDGQAYKYTDKTLTVVVSLLPLLLGVLMQLASLHRYY